MYTKFCHDFPIVTIEDPFDQDDWDHTAAFTAEGVCQVPLPPSTNHRCTHVTKLVIWRTRAHRPSFHTHD